MENKVIVDSHTLSKKKSKLKLIIPVAATVVVAIVGVVYALSHAATPGRLAEPVNVPKAINFLTPLPKIKVNATGFYQSPNGAAFVPRGFNYVRLATDSTKTVYHSTFEPGVYTPSAGQDIVNNMKSNGYNVARVFIDAGAFITPSHGISTAVGSTTPINAAYMANIVDFVTRASDAGIYTLPSLDYIPANTYYYNTAGSPPPNIQGNNVLYLDPRYVAAKQMYIKQFITELTVGMQKTKRCNVQNSCILAYQTDNEVFFQSNKAPLSTMSGTLTSLNGVSYDMSKPASRQEATDANLITYSAKMKEAITSVDPEGLLTMGFFTNNAVSRAGYNGYTDACATNCTAPNYRTPGRPSHLSNAGKVDFIDVHVYPSSSTYNLKNDLTSIEYASFKKPFILGELGASKKVYNNSITAAALGMKSLQTTSCTLGAKGWLFWTWDTNTTTTLADQGSLYSLIDSKGAINGQLAPVARPDPCK